MRKIRILQSDNHQSKSSSRCLWGMTGPIAQEYGIQIKTVRDIWTRKTWRQVTRHLWKSDRDARFLDQGTSSAEETCADHQSPKEDDEVRESSSSPLNLHQNFSSDNISSLESDLDMLDTLNSEKNVFQYSDEDRFRIEPSLVRWTNVLLRQSCACAKSCTICISSLKEHIKSHQNAPEIFKDPFEQDFKFWSSNIPELEEVNLVGFEKKLRNLTASKNRNFENI